MPAVAEVTRRRRGSSGLVPTGLFPALMWLAGGLLLGFIVLPVIRLVTSSTPAGLATALGDADIRDALLLSVVDATITAVLATGLGVPLAYLLARRRFPGRASAMRSSRSAGSLTRA